jgi:hypothetical protein
MATSTATGFMAHLGPNRPTDLPGANKRENGNACLFAPTETSGAEHNKCTAIAAAHAPTNSTKARVTRQMELTWPPLRGIVQHANGDLPQHECVLGDVTLVMKISRLVPAL